MSATIAVLEHSRFVRDLPVKGGENIAKGNLVMTKTGYAYVGAAGTGFTAMGIAANNADNTSGADGALTVDVEQGVFAIPNSATNVVTAANVANAASSYIEGAEVVGNDSTGRSAAGEIVGLTSQGVLVKIKK